jgi:lambda repressor-like predicted transcriptional regulator
MNKLPIAKRVQILSMLVEGSSMRSVSRVADVSINTVAKLLAEAGEACLAIHDEEVHNVPAKRVQCDEIWSFCYAKQRTIASGQAKAAPEDAGDVWTWTAIDADSKLIVSYLAGGRDAGYATEFMHDLVGRLSRRAQLTTDGHKAYRSNRGCVRQPRRLRPTRQAVWPRQHRRSLQPAGVHRDAPQASHRPP